MCVREIVLVYLCVKREGLYDCVCLCTCVCVCVREREREREKGRINAERGRGDDAFLHE